MNYAVEADEQNLVITIPLSEIGNDLAQEEIVKYCEYVALGAKSQNMAAFVREAVAETKGVWWAANKERFRGIPEFERFFQ